jgi:molybdopterin-binding protein
MGLQHPSNRSSVLFVDARQHRDRAWCIEDEPSLNSRQPYELDACRPRQKVVEVMKGQTTTHVGIDIGASVVTASITNEAVDELKLASGQSASAVIRASDVIVAID